MVRPPLSARAIGPARNATNAIGPGGRDRDGGQDDREQQQRVAYAARDAETGRGVVAELDDPQRPGQPHHDRQQHQQQPASSRIVGQSAPLTLPVSQRSTSCASYTSARVKRYWMTDSRAAATPMPISTRR